jgi:hypothetical protein
LSHAALVLLLRSCDSWYYHINFVCHALRLLSCCIRVIVDSSSASTPKSLLICCAICHQVLVQLFDLDDSSKIKYRYQYCTCISFLYDLYKYQYTKSTAKICTVYMTTVTHYTYRYIYIYIYIYIFNSNTIIQLINIASSTGQVPTASYNGVMVLIPKPKQQGYCGIPLLERLYKLLSMIIHNWLKATIHNFMSPSTASAHNKEPGQQSWTSKCWRNKYNRTLTQCTWSF